MIPNDSGGGADFTVWEGYDIVTLHNMVQGVTDAQLATSWDQVAAWRKTHELLDNHAAKLSMYRQGLVEHWPPETNEASAAFLKHVDELLLSLQQASTAASENYLGLASLTSAVSTARVEVKKAYEEYTKNQTKLNAYQEQVDAYKADTTGLPQPSPGPSPVAPSRQQELTKKAQEAMAVLSGAAVDSNWKMQIPPDYAPPPIRQDDNVQRIDGPIAFMPPAPVIPQPRTSASTPSGQPPVQVPLGTGQGLPGANGPVLSGGLITPPPPPPPTPTPPITGPIGPTPPGIGPIPAGLGGGPVPGGGGKKPGGLPTGTPRTGGTAPELVTEARTGIRSPGGPRPLPPGGVIGPAQGGGVVNSAAPRGGAAGRRVNPVGGVLGQGGGSAGTAAGPGRAGGPGTASGGMAAQSLLAGQRGGKGDREREESQGWDPDDPWAVEHGVAPVLEPGSEPTSHDPGPGVIGIDR